MTKIQLFFFSKKLEKWFHDSPLDEIITKILLIAYTLKINKSYKYLNKNKISLYDTSLFIAFVVRSIYFNKSYISITKRQEFDDELLSNLITGFNHFFKCSPITNAGVNLSRFDFYDEIMDNYLFEPKGNAFSAILDVFTNIIKSDIANKNFQVVDSNSPLYMLNSLENNTICKLEAEYALETALTYFNCEIEKLQSVLPYDGYDKRP
ncbi:MAG: hypothetical protein IJZ75_07870 [Clostridia bacterium]|nr:hypothetical protein [Clostridia bacterium]